MTDCHKPLLKLLAMSILALSTPIFAQSVTYDLPQNKLTAEIVYLTLIGDLARDRDQPDTAYDAYMILASKTRDPRYAELAYKVALATQKAQAAIDAAQVLKQLAPNAVLGQNLITQVKIDNAYTLIDKQLYRPAYNIAREMLIQDPKNVAALSLLTSVADALGYDDESLAAVESWVKLEPENPEALNSLGYFLANKNIRLSEAEQMIRKANSIKSNTPHIMDSMGWVAYRQGRLAEALPLLKQAAIMEPHEDVLTHLGEVLWQSDKREEAIKTFQVAYQTNAYSQNLRDTLERLGIALSNVNIKKGK